MTIRVRVSCWVTLKHMDHESTYNVQLEHYETLRDRLDRGEQGWIELDSAWGDGKMFCRLEDIVDLFAATPEYVEERFAWDQEQKAEDVAS